MGTLLGSYNMPLYESFKQFYLIDRPIVRTPLLDFWEVWVKHWVSIMSIDPSQPCGI